MSISMLRDQALIAASCLAAQDNRPAVFIGAGYVWCAGIQDGVKEQLTRICSL